MAQKIEWTIDVCQLDDNGIYVGQTIADLDIYAKDGSYIMPSGAVDTEPPEQREGYAAKWDGKSWEYLEDHREETMYSTADGTASEIDFVGEIPKGYTLEPRPSEAHEWKNGKWRENAELAEKLKSDALEKAREDKLYEIGRAAQDFVKEKSGTENIPDFEADTWAAQAEEARAWDEDKTAETPVLTAIAAARGVDLDVLRAAALKNAQDYAALTASVAGQRQKLADMVKNAETAEEVLAVSVSYQYPA